MACKVTLYCAKHLCLNDTTSALFIHFNERSKHHGALVFPMSCRSCRVEAMMCGSHLCNAAHVLHSMGMSCVRASGRCKYAQFQFRPVGVCLETDVYKEALEGSPEYRSGSIVYGILLNDKGRPQALGVEEPRRHFRRSLGHMPDTRLSEMPAFRRERQKPLL